VRIDARGDAGQRCRFLHELLHTPRGIGCVARGLLKFRTKFWGIKTLKKERMVAY